MNSFNRAIRVAAVGEATTGVVLLLFPHVVAQFLFGAAPAGAGLAVARIAGIALVGLGLACWPDPVNGRAARRAPIAMLVYSALAAMYLGFLAISGELRGPLLWPAVVVHLIVTVWLATGLKPRKRG